MHSLLSALAFSRIVGLALVLAAAGPSLRVRGLGSVYTCGLGSIALYIVPLAPALVATIPASAVITRVISCTPLGVARVRAWSLTLLGSVCLGGLRSRLSDYWHDDVIGLF